MPYKFNGKEFDEETGLYYHGARYMNPVASVWYGIDQLTEKHPHMGAYVFCYGNPIKLVDPDDRDVTSALLESVGTFVVSAGASFVENLINTGGNVDVSLRLINWKGATVEACTSFATSLVFSGASTTKLIKKLASTKIGKSNLAKFMEKTAENMVASISSNFINRKYKSITDIKFREELIVAVVGSLEDVGLGHIAAKLKKSLIRAKSTMNNAQLAYDFAKKTIIVYSNNVD